MQDYKAQHNQQYSHIQIISKRQDGISNIPENHLEKTPISNPSYSLFAASSAKGDPAADAGTGALGSSFAERAKAAELASQSEQLAHVLNENERPPTSESAALGGFIKLGRNKNSRCSKGFESNDLNGLAPLKYVTRRIVC